MKLTVFSEVKCTADGTTEIRLEKQVVDAAGKAEATRYHRFLLEPGASLEAQLDDIYDHIKEDGYPPLSQADLDRLRAIVGVEHTPARVAAFRKKREEQERARATATTPQPGPADPAIAAARKIN